MDLNETKILMVGAGGIGCELLKNLILTGFNEIEVIDLDTIELSNLNRQFLFQKMHVGRPKAIIARESVLKYNPNANIIAHHDSIMNVKYNVEYFKKFSIVLNALDNKAARSHVNRLCLAADVPLIESGSAGYLGQVTFIKRGLTECYDCLPKPPVKSFPGCTIRNTPSEPIHCIVWAKHLFNQLFGAEDPDQDVSPDGEDPENMADAGKTAVEKASNEEAVVRQSTRQWAKETKYDSVKLFNKLFSDDIKYLLSMANLWEKRKPPKPLDWLECLNNNDENQISETEKQQQEKQVSNGDPNKLKSLKVWSISECCKMFSSSVEALKNRLEEANKSEENPILSWDKDDEDAMNFVTAASNLRCFIFSITLKSKFETKSLAGNIIPAIATTNAIVAGLIVLEALKVLQKNYDDCKTVYLRDKPSLNKLIVATQLVKPNDKCYVCASKPEISVKLNLNTFTIKQFETKILKQELNMVQPDIEIDDGTGRIILSSEEGETEENNDKTLSFFGLADQSSLKCDDFFQNFELKITLLHCDKFDAQATKDYEIVSENQMLKNIQEQISKEKQNVEASLTVAEKVIQDTEMSNAIEEKKRSYDTAFEDEEPTVSSTVEKKRKSCSNTDENSSNSKQPEEKDEVLYAINSISNSINDASDAISEEDEQVVQSKEAYKKQNCNSNQEIIVEDDDIIIEENSNDFKNDERSNSLSSNLQSDSNQYSCQSNNAVSNGNSNKNNESNDDDVIECSSDEDIIEINDEDEDKNKQVLKTPAIISPSFNNKKMKLIHESNGNHQTDSHLQNYHQNGGIDLNNIQNLNGNKPTNGTNGHSVTNASASFENKEDEDGFTVIE